MVADCDYRRGNPGDTVVGGSDGYFGRVVLCGTFLCMPGALSVGRKICTQRKMRRLRSLYCKRPKLAKRGVSFYCAGDTKYRKPLKNASKIFNGAFRSMSELSASARVGVFLAPEKETEPVSGTSREEQSRSNVQGFFAVIGYRVIESADTSDSVVPDEMPESDPYCF